MIANLGKFQGTIQNKNKSELTKSNYQPNKLHNNYVIFRHFVVANKRN